MARDSFDHREIEASAQKKWAELDLYRTDVSDQAKPPYYLLFEFPYPSGDLHIGHWYAYAVTDIHARMKRMQGNNVLFPIGFDSFGLPAENAAIKNGADPKEWTYANIDRMRQQIKSIGTSVDWSREVITSDPEYYRWTQWLFTKLYEQNLAERRNAAVKWCPKDKTVLANEQVINGKCERCDTLVEEKMLTQWFLKITDYAKRLLDDLETLPWREDIKEAQRSWIGESEGAKITFPVIPAAESDSETKAVFPTISIDVFTTRPDTLFGATYLVLAPEHPGINELLELLENATDVSVYIEATKAKTERERSENKEKTGVRLEGVMATNPANKESIPVYVTDYVLGSYGTGAVMAVPAHDERDFEFAQKHHLPIRHVVIPRRFDENNPHQEGKELVVRNIIVGIVRNPKTGQYLGLKWKKQGWTSFITGGIDDGEDAVEAARREIQEETGYKNLKYIRTLGGPVHAEFFAAHKDVNRIAYANHLLFELENEEMTPVEDAEKALHEPVWLDEKELTRDRMDHAQMDIILSRLRAPDAAYTEDGMLFDSGEFSGRTNRSALWDIAASVGAERVTNYRIRDWLVSRQRYWGCPIPVVYDPEGKPHPIPAEHLPWLLPTDIDFSPGAAGVNSNAGNKNGAPLASSKELHERVTRIFGEGWTPEYDTLDTFVDSSWYYLRYLAPHDGEHFSNEALMKRWLPVNRYSGGSEHTTMHLLYARFFHKALYDFALVPTPEPFYERFNRGIILGPDGQKMSKRWGNVVNPDEMVAKFGSDAVRLYLAFIGPYNEPGHYPWNLDGVVAMRRFLDRVVTLSEKIQEGEIPEGVRKGMAKWGRNITRDAERFKFNTAISWLMILLKEFESFGGVQKDAWTQFLAFLAPFAPHLAEHLWQKAGQEGSVHQAAWPSYREEDLIEELVTVVVQVSGKKRGELRLSPDASEEEALEKAREIPLVAETFSAAEQPKIVYVPGRILNIVSVLQHK